MTLPVAAQDPWPPRPLLARALTRGIRKRLQRALVTAARLRDEADRGAVHDFRVASRRLSEMLWLWKPMLRAAESDHMRRRLRRQRRRLGRVRETEVHLGLLNRLRGAAAQEARDRILETLRRRHRRQRRAAARRAAHPPVGRRVGGWLAVIRGPVAWGAAQAKVEARMGRLRSRMWRTFAQAVAAGSTEPLHAARIALKRWRYALESLEEVAMCAGRRDEIDGLVELQETLGTVQDLATLARLLGEVRPRRRAVRDVELQVLIRLERRRAVARRAISSWLERHAARAPENSGPR